VPVNLVFEMKPELACTVAVAVPLPNGPAELVTGRGTTVAVLIITTTPALEEPGGLISLSSPDAPLVDEAAFAVSVTVTVMVA